jgi:hypothetical protein
MAKGGSGSPAQSRMNVPGGNPGPRGGTRPVGGG